MKNYKMLKDLNSLEAEDWIMTGPERNIVKYKDLDVALNWPKDTESLWYFVLPIRTCDAPIYTIPLTIEMLLKNKDAFDIVISTPELSAEVEKETLSVDEFQRRLRHTYGYYAVANNFKVEKNDLPGFISD